MHENYTFPLIPSFTGIYSRMDAVLEFERDTMSRAYKVSSLFQRLWKHRVPPGAAIWIYRDHGNTVSQKWLCFLDIFARAGNHPRDCRDCDRHAHVKDCFLKIAILIRLKYLIIKFNLVIKIFVIIIHLN